MPNHYTNVIQIIQDTGRDEAEVDSFGDRLREWFASDPCERVRPMPAEYRSKDMRDERWYNWAISEQGWGTKWGMYDKKPPVVLPGDSHAWMLMGCTAWGPPNDETRDAIAEALLKLGAERVRWSGIDPYDDTFKELGEWAAPARRTG
jgi:hypothetical protein